MGLGEKPWRRPDVVLTRGTCSSLRARTTVSERMKMKEERRGIDVEKLGGEGAAELAVLVLAWASA